MRKLPAKQLSLWSKLSSGVFFLTGFCLLALDKIRIGVTDLILASLFLGSLFLTVDISIWFEKKWGKPDMMAFRDEHNS